MTLALLVAAWLGGVLLGLETDVRLAAVFLLLGGATCLGLALYVVRWPLLPAVLALFLLIGVWRAESSQSELHPLATQSEQMVSVEGVVADDPEASNQRTRFELAVTSIIRGGRGNRSDGAEEVEGRLLVYAQPSADLAARRGSPYFRYGDTLSATGLLQRPEPFEGFDYPAFLATEGITGVFFPTDVEILGEDSGGWRGEVYSVRGRLSESIEDALPHPQSALGQALLLGQRGELPPDLVEDFRSSGAAHLLAISGLHVGALMVLVLGIAILLLGRRRYLYILVPPYLLVPLVVIWGYALVSGSPPSVLRAAAMGTVFLAALGLGRPNSVLPALALAAAVMTAVDPGLLRQIGFQLSFAAVGGIAVAHTYLGVRLTREGESASATGGWGFRLARPVLALTVVSAAAALATWPLVALNFGEVALLGIPATLLAVPAMPFILAGTLAAAVGGLISGALGQVLGSIVWVPLTYLIELVSAFPDWTWQAGWAGKWLVAVWYGGLALLLLAPRPRQIRAYLDTMRGWKQALPAGPPSPRTIGLAAVVVVVAAAASILWFQVAEGPDGDLHVHFFDVGQGDAALITTPDGRQVLVDGGPDTNSATAAISGAVSGGDRSLDLVVLTHLDADHARGLLEVLDRFEIGAVLVGKDTPAAAMNAQWQGELNRQQMAAVQVYDGYQIDLGSGVVIDVLNPSADAIDSRVPASNNDSVVLRLAYRAISFLLTGDVESEAESLLARHDSEVASTVLKVAHHGSKTSSTSAFLDRVSPSAAVVSVGQANPFGHPNPQVLERLEARLGFSGVFRTDRDGDIEFVTDGSALWVSTER